MAVVANSKEEEEAKANEGDAKDGHDDADSDASHASMPEMIPVSPKRWPSPEASALRSPRRLGRGLLQKRPIGRGRGRGRALLDPSDLLPNRGLKRRSAGDALKADQESAQERPSLGAAERSSLGAADSNSNVPPAFSLRNSATPVSGSFGQRANLLAAALDQIGGPSPAQDSSSSSAPTVTQILSHTCTPVGGVGDDIEISREARHRFKESCNMEMELAGILDSDSDEEDAPPDTPGKEKKREGASESDSNARQPSAVDAKQAFPASKRRRKNAAVLKDCPPGVPAAQLAAPIVAAAASAAAAGASKKEDTDHPADDPPAGLDSEKLTFGKSFGPRFKGLSPVQLQAARSSWTLHSLADVRTASSQDNQRAAAACFAELRARRSLGNSAESKDSPDNTGNEGSAPASKPVFRRPPPRKAAKTPTDGMGDGTSSNTGGTVVAGVRTMEACVVGAIKRRNSSDAAQSTMDNATAQTGSAVASKKRRRQLSLVLDDDNADVE